MAVRVYPACFGPSLTSLRRISATSRWLFKAARCRAEKPSSFLTSASCRARAKIISVALEKHKQTQLHITPAWISHFNPISYTLGSFVLRVSSGKLNDCSMILFIVHHASLHSRSVTKSKYLTRWVPRLTRAQRGRGNSSCCERSCARLAVFWCV